MLKNKKIRNKQTINRIFLVMHARNASFFQDASSISPQATQPATTKSILSPWLVKKTVATITAITSARALRHAVFDRFVFLQTSSTRTQPLTPILPGKTTISTNFLIQQRFNSLGITYNIVRHSPPMALLMTFIASSQSTKMLSALSNKTTGCTYTA